MTKQEFFIDTVKYYAADPVGRRNTNDSRGCNYLAIRPCSEGCAIGRYITKEAAEKFDHEGLYIRDIMRSDELKQMLPFWMQWFDTIFLSDVQRLHDNNENWTDTGLSNEGKERVLIYSAKHNIDTTEIYHLLNKINRP